MKKDMNISIQELFMAKAGKNGWDKCFRGTLDRRTDEHGEILHGKIKVNDRIIQASARTKEELGEKLDELVLIALHGDNLYKGSGISMN